MFARAITLAQRKQGIKMQPVKIVRGKPLIKVDANPMLIGCKTILGICSH